MITKNDLKQIESMQKEITYFENKLKKIDEKPIKEVQDSVRGSSAEFPYVTHTCKIEGFESPRNRNKYKKMIRSKQYKLEKALNHLEYELNKIEDSEIRMIIRYKYQDNYSWVKIMHLMEYDSEDVARKKLERYFKMLKSA